MRYITSKELVTITECKKKYELQKLSLKGGNQRITYFNKAIQILTKGIVNKKNYSKLGEEIRTYLEKMYQEEWFLLSWQKEETIKRDMELFQRFFNYFHISYSNIICSDEEFRLTIELSCNEIKIDGIIGKADLIVEQPDNRIIGIIICRNFSKEFSYLARKSENKIQNSIELLILMQGLMNKYPNKKIEVSMIRLCAASDRPNALIQFEEKKGENIIRFTNVEYLQSHSEGVYDGIRKVVEQAELIPCKGCTYEDGCKVKNKIYAGQTEEKTRSNIKFSDIQKKVIYHAQGAVRVCAGPGSGKTTVLVARIQHLIQSGISSKRILAVTFTKKAAKEMKDRILLDVDDVSNQPEISTLHALAYQILNKNEYLIGTVRLVRKVDQMCLLAKILDYVPMLFNASYEGITMRYGLISSLLKDFEFINKKGKEFYAISFPKKDIKGIMNIKRMYDAALKERGYITFDDQIIMAVELLKKYLGIQKTIQESYDYIMVDEVQDLDSHQAEFINMIVKSCNNIMICGDSDQSIYSFRGGSNQFMLDFLSVYTEAKDICLTDNYRSSEEIVNAAYALIQNNKKRVPIQSRALFNTGFKPIHIQYFNPNKLFLLIEDIRKKGYQYQDIAIIATKNKTLLDLCDIVDKEGERNGMLIPLERPKFYLRDDYIFQVILDILELKIKGMNQDKPLYRLLVGMGCKVEKINSSLSIYEDHLKNRLIYNFYGEEAGQYYIKTEDHLKDSYGKIYKMLQKLNQPVKKALMELTEKFLPSNFCIQEVMEELNTIINEKKIKGIQQFYECLSAIKIFEDDTRLHYTSRDPNYVHMITAHDAKGKEFNVVVLLNIDEYEREDEEEDRRLLYVALTRAKRVLFITETYPGKSQFLKELGTHIISNGGRRYE